MQNDVKGRVLEFKGVVGSQRRITIPRIYVLAYGLSEGELVKVTLCDNETGAESSFLAHIQRGFRIQVPEVEYEGMELKKGSILEVQIEKVDKGKGG